MTIETIQPESETQKTIIKPFSLKSRYANEKNHHKNLSLFKQGMRKKGNLHIAFLCSSKVCEKKKTFMMLSCSIEICEKKFGRIFATVRESPPYLSIRSQPIPSTIYIR